MKKLFLIIAVVALLSSCNKKTECAQELDNKVYSLTHNFEVQLDGLNNSLHYGIINDETYNRGVMNLQKNYEEDVQNAKDEYDDCIKVFHIK